MAKRKTLEFTRVLSSHWPDSNRRPTHYECVALPTALQWHPNSNCHSFDATRLLPKQQPCHHDLTGNRTRVYAVRGRRLSRLTSGLKVNRGDVIRTRGLCVPNAALYQTEPRLDTFGSIIHLFQKVNHKLSKFLK